MSAIPQIYYQRDILKKIDNLIMEGKEFYKDISQLDKDDLTILCMNAIQDDAYLFMIDTDYLSLTLQKLKEFIRGDSIENALSLAHQLRDNALEYAEYVLERLFSERYELFYAEMQHEKGLRPHTSEQTGETIWI